MRRNGFTLLELLIVVAVIGILAALLFPVISHKNPGNAKRSSCQSNLKQIGLGLAQYIQDYHERLPLVSSGDRGWADSILPYSKSQQVFQCPMINNPTADFSTDYFLNARATGLQRKHISAGSLTILLGEGLDNGGTNSHFSELPFDWKTSEDSPAKRHLDGANYAFADGHVKWFRPAKATTQPIEDGAFTFSPR